MDASYTERQSDKAGRDVMEIYRLAEKRLGEGCLKWNQEELRNAFQVFRYAFKEWAKNKPRGVVWRALMYGAEVTGEVKVDIKKPEIGEHFIYCEDPEVAVVIEELLKMDGYETEN